MAIGYAVVGGEKRDGAGQHATGFELFGDAQHRFVQPTKYRSEGAAVRVRDVHLLLGLPIRGSKLVAVGLAAVGRLPGDEARRRAVDRFESKSGAGSGWALIIATTSSANRLVE